MRRVAPRNHAVLGRLIRRSLRAVIQVSRNEAVSKVLDEEPEAIACSLIRSDRWAAPSGTIASAPFVSVFQGLLILVGSMAASVLILVSALRRVGGDEESSDPSVPICEWMNFKESL